MDVMLEEDKNLKNSLKDTSLLKTSTVVGPAPYEAEGFRLGSYTKTNKLVTALYMVTDILDTNEPLRNKLRSLGADIISDISSISGYKDLSNFMSNKVSSIISLLDISSAMNLISEMNCNILKKEFIELKQSVEESKQGSILSLSEFFIDESPLLNKEGEGGGNLNHHLALKGTPPQKGGDKNNSKGHTTRIGIQKGGTLLQALSKVEGKALKDIKEIKVPKTKSMSVRKSPAQYEAGSFRSGFDNLKKERREEIIKIIRMKDIATITDIKNSASGVLISCGEKTLQRELASMVSDGVLKKIGEKRWSKYFL